MISKEIEAHLNQVNCSGSQTSSAQAWVSQTSAYNTGMLPGTWGLSLSPARNTVIVPESFTRKSINLEIKNNWVQNPFRYNVKKGIFQITFYLWQLFW